MRACTCFVLLFILAGSVQAQAPLTQTVDDWPTSTMTFAATAGQGTLELPAGCTIQTFRDGRLQLPTELFTTLRESKLVSAHAYSRTATTAATDLGRALRSAGVIGPVVDDLVPENAAADLTAARWVEQELQPQQGHRVAVLAFAKEQTSGEAQIVLVLIRGLSTADGVHIDRIHYGTPATAAP